MKRLWLIFFLFSQPFSQTTVAVMEFETEGLDNISSTALSSIIRREVKNTDGLILLDRNMMEQVLQEQGFQQSGCTTSECAVEVGQLLGVQKMITGSLSALGQLYLVEIFILNVENGQIEKSEMFEHIGRIEELIKPLKNSTKKLLNTNQIDFAEETFIYIESIPAGGMVSVNDNNVGSSPLKYKVEPGEYQIKIKSQGYQDWMQYATVSLGENKVLSGKLMKVSSNNVVLSNGSDEWDNWGISKELYLEFYTLGISKADYINVISPNDYTLDDVKKYTSLKIPKETWLDLIKKGQSPSYIENIFEFSWNYKGLELYHTQLKRLKMPYVKRSAFNTDELIWNINIMQDFIEEKKLSQFSVDELISQSIKVKNGVDIFFTHSITQVHHEVKVLMFKTVNYTDSVNFRKKIIKDLKGDLKVKSEVRASRAGDKVNKRNYIDLINKISIANIFLMIANEVTVEEFINWIISE